MNDAARTLTWEERIRSDVDRTIARALGHLEGASLRGVLEHATTGGKRIRPMLTVLACAAAGGRDEDALPAAAALELLHASSLVHDDIMDDAQLRRGAPAIHVAHGIPKAILAGDALVALAYRVLSEGPSLAPAETLSVFSNCFLSLCEGQCADIDTKESMLYDPSGHHWIVERKTARLAEACMRIGALAATTDRRLIDAAARFGLHLGFAYQATDDLLDAIGNEAVMGKSTGRDAQNGRQTYLTLAYPDTDRIAATRTIIEHHTVQALAALDELPGSEARSRLHILARILLDRNA